MKSYCDLLQSEISFVHQYQYGEDVRKWIGDQLLGGLSRSGISV
ncbi:hypothetical protein [Belliella filtrata]|nr:hypothetical protein [Belliella filtrata]